jgi:hypothetical protein
VVFVLLQSTVWAYQPYLQASGFSTAEIGCIYAVVYLVAATVAHHFDALRRYFSEPMLLWGLLGTLTGTFLILGSISGPIALGFMFVQAAANGVYSPMVKLLMQHGADATISMADRQTPIHAAIAGRASEQQILELIRIFHKAGTDVNAVALVNHGEEVRGGSALHFAVRKRQKEVIKLLASLKIDMNAVDQDGLTALDYTQSRGFMPFMALQTPIYKDEAALLRELGATKMMAKSPVWPVLGPPQGVWADIWPLGESQVHPPIYKPQTD